MFDVKVLNRRNGVYSGVTDLPDGRKLQIRFSTWDIYLKSVDLDVGYRSLTMTEP